MLSDKHGEPVSILLKPSLLVLISIGLLVGCGSGSDTESSITITVGEPELALTGVPASSVNEESTYSFTPQASSNTGSVSFSITNQPSWATFDSSTGNLSGTPDDEHVGSTTGIIITGTDEKSSSDIGPFSITVEAVNDAPVLQDQTISDLTLTSEVGFTISAADVDSDTSNYVYTIITNATDGLVAVDDNAASTFTYTPNSLTDITQDSFLVQLSDGESTSEQVIINLTFISNTNSSGGIEISGTPASSVNEEATYDFTPTEDTTSVGSVVYSISNKPSWATFSTSTGQLTGSPDDADVGTDSNITITATDDSGSSSIGPFSITVNAINDAPVLSNQSKTSLAFSSNVAFNLTASDVDSATSSYVYDVVSQASHGSIVISNHASSAFEYQPSSVSGTSGDSFTVRLSDGEDFSATATVTLSFSDGSAPNITLTPNNGASSVAIDSTYSITSDDPLDTSTITYNGSAGACTGTLQISKDSFTNCMAVTSAVASDLNRTITITTSADMDAATEYKIKVTTGVANLFSDNLASDETNTFNTAASGLLITEISESYYVNSSRWFELYNGTSSTVDISDYTFKSLAYNGSTIVTHTFSLPSVNLSAGQYIVVRANTSGDTYTPNSRVVYVEDGGTYPYWTSTGFIDLLKAGVTEDFVTFGSSTSPTTSAAWSGTYATAPPSVADQYGHSIGRDGSNTDTNTAADWESYDFSTMGGTNDVTCTTDTDADGIPDCSEVSGSTFAGLPLYDWGARTGQKDIFIELDYMDATNGGGQSADEGIIPRQEALQNVVDAFAAQGIAVHFDVGDLYDNAAGTDPADFDLGGGEEVPFQDAITFSTSTNVYHYKLDYMDFSRTQIFHYLIFGNTQSGAAGSSGLAELNGNDLLVTLGEWGLNSSTTANTNILINYQASTLMHELGHNLGLYHGGSNDGNNYEPNYISIMNYLYQLEGLPTIASDEGDRFYKSSTYHGGNGTCYSGLSNAANTSTFVMDFSHGDGADLNIANLNETLGLGQSSTDGVDYNCDGDKTDTGVSWGSGTWTDHDDWSNINLDFQHYFSGDDTGAVLSRMVSAEESELMPDKVGDDKAPVADEYSPTPEFFERLRQQLNQ